jgi:hypothetical protein
MSTIADKRLAFARFFHGCPGKLKPTKHADGEIAASPIRRYWRQKMKIRSCVFLLSLIPYPSASFADDVPAVSVRFGVVGLDPVTKSKVIIETKNIPFKDCKTDEAFGYSVTDKSGRRVSAYAVFYPPSPVKKVDEGLWGNAETAHVTGLTTNTTSYSGSGISEHCFTESDPRGEWKVVIFVNAVRHETVTFKTVE